MSGPTVRSGATLDLTVRANRPVVDAQVVPGPAGPPGASAFGVTASGNVMVPVSNAINGSAAVTFPAGRFSAAPQIALATNNQVYAAGVADLTAAGCTIWVRHVDATVNTVNVWVYWVAVLTTGPGQPPAGYPILATNLFDRPNPTTATGWNILGTPSIVYNTGDPDVGDYARITISAVNNGYMRTLIGFVPDTPHTYSAFYRNAGTAPITLRFGTTANVNIREFTVPADNVWRRYSAVFSPTATQGQFRVVQSVGEAVQPWPYTIDVARVNVTPGPALFDYFDGNTPGGRWTGAIGNSVSELLGPRMGDIQGIIATRTPLELTGVGMPDGVVSAPVGSYYTDTAATNGAIRWIKQTGTGNTGWQVLWGDTGTRVITGLVINGWTGNTAIRRQNNTVTLWITNLNSTNATSDDFLPDLGPGWRVPYTRPAILVGSNGNPPVMARLMIPQSGQAQPWSIARTGMPPLTFNNVVSWDTGEQWPTTLP